MFGFRKQNRLDRVMELIAAAGKATSDWFQHDDCHKFPNGDRWISFCGTIPAFAFIIAHEAIIKSITEQPTSEQRAFFKSIEDALFTLYKKGGADHQVPLRQCLLLESELTAVLQAFQIDYGVEITPETMVNPDTILGIILPNRLSIYQKDWIAGLIDSSLPGKNFSDYAAMRFAADLAGIVTPSSLVGHKALPLGIEGYPRASIVLTEFACSYMKAFP